MWPCKSVVCRIEIKTASGLSAAVALASVGTVLSNPAWPASFKNSRRVQTLFERNIAATSSPNDTQESVGASKKKKPHWQVAALRRLPRAFGTEWRQRLPRGNWKSDNGVIIVSLDWYSP